MKQIKIYIKIENDKIATAMEKEGCVDGDELMIVGALENLKLQILDKYKLLFRKKSNDN